MQSWLRSVLVTVLLVVLAIGFAYSMGAHYTGACMGMPHALRAVSAWRALAIMAPLTLIGATFASHKVEHTVGHNLLAGAGLSVTGLVIVIGVAFALTSLFNLLKVPTSTIQILVFTVIGAGLAAGIGVRWHTIIILAILWGAAPIVAAALGYLLTRILDLVPAMRTDAHLTGAQLAQVATTTAGGGTGQSDDGSAAGGAEATSGRAAPPPARIAGGPLAAGLLTVGAVASFAMGSNDVANATGSLVGTGTMSPLTAGLIGGLGLAAGVLTWGRPLLRKVAFDIITVDRPMATAAQLVQAVVVLVAVAFGFFTSMNQALIGAMTGTAAARGRHTVHASTLYGVFRGWLFGPAAGIALGWAITALIAANTSTGTLLAGG
jgi:PiT family inorganic phosphate transporter